MKSISGADAQTAGLAMDSRNLEGLKRNAKSATPGTPEYDKTIDQVSKQFESVFLQWMLKSMRDATPEGGLFTDSNSKMYQSMYDQELVQHLSGKGLGLAGEIARQLKASTQNIVPAGTPIEELQARRKADKSPMNTLFDPRKPPSANETAMMPLTLRKLDR